MEIGRSPEFSLLELLVKDSLVGKRHDAEVRLGWEEATAWFKKHVTRNYVRFKHPLVQQKCAEGLAHDHVDGFEGDFVRCYIFNFTLDDFHHVFEAVGFDQDAGDLSCAACFTCIDLFGPGLRRKQT